MSLASPNPGVDNRQTMQPTTRTRTSLLRVLRLPVPTISRHPMIRPVSVLLWLCLFSAPVATTAQSNGPPTARSLQWKLTGDRVTGDASQATDLQGDTTCREPAPTSPVPVVCGQTSLMCPQLGHTLDDGEQRPQGQDLQASGGRQRVPRDGPLRCPATEGA